MRAPFVATTNFLLAILFGVLADSSVLAGTIAGRVIDQTKSGSSADFVIYVDDIEDGNVGPAKTAVMDQKDLTFVPHVLVVPVGTTVEFPNSDPVSHNVFSISPAKRFNLGLYPKGAGRRVVFDKPGVVELLCNVHLEMSAYILVLKNPYFSRTGPDGTFRIEEVPAGEHVLRMWHEAMPTQEQQVSVPKEGTVNVTFSGVGEN